MSPRSKEVEKPQTEEERTEQALLETLAELGGKRLSRASGLKFEGKEMILPETMDVDDGISYLQAWKKNQEAEQAFTRKFMYRPWDGAHALHSALTKVFGMTGLQKPVWTMFGSFIPEQQQISVPVAVDRSVNVPWGGNLQVPMFKGTMEVGSWKHKELGRLSRLTITAPKKFAAHVEGLFSVVEEELKTNSIYKAKAIDGQEEAEFVDLSGVERRKVIYSDEVEAQLDANVWSLIQFTEMQRRLDLPLKRAILLHGPYGTGKTLAGYLTAQIAVANGWTCIYCRPVKDDLFKVIQTARLYQPCVVFVEDIDLLASGETSDPIEMLLDILDGIQAKGTEIMVVVTTNHPENIHQGVLRPGRLDSMIEISALDVNGIRRMIESVVPGNLIDSGALDYAAIHEAMKGYLPAFVKESIDRAIRYAVVREGGSEPTELVTEDFVQAAEGLRPHWTMMTQATEGKPIPVLEQALSSVVRSVVHGTDVVETDESGEPTEYTRYALSVQEDGN